MRTLSVSIALSSVFFASHASAFSQPASASFLLAQDQPAKRSASQSALSKLKLRVATDGPEEVLEEIKADLERLRSEVQGMPEFVNGTPSDRYSQVLAKINYLELQSEVVRNLIGQAEPGTEAAGRQSDRAQAEANADLRHTVDAALRSRRDDLLEELGPAILDVVADIVLETQRSTDLAGYKRKPLSWLAVNGREHALDVAKQLVKREGVGWDRLVASSFPESIWVPEGMTAELAERSEAYDLMVQLFGSSEVDADSRVAILFPFLWAGVSNEFTLRAARSVHEYFNFGSFENKRLRWLHMAWLDDANPEIRMTAAKALTGGGLEGEVEVLERLAEDSDAAIRQLVPQSLSLSVRKGVLVSPQFQELWRRCLEDENARVREATYEGLWKIEKYESQELLPQPLIRTLVRRLESAEEQALARSLLPRIAGLLVGQPHGPELGETAALMASSGLERFDQSLPDRIRFVTGYGRTLLAVLEHLDWSKNEGGRFNYVYRNANKTLKDIPVEYCLTRYARLIQNEHIPDGLLDDMMSDLVLGVSLDSLGPDSAVEVLLHDRTDLTMAGRFLRNTAWDPAKVQLSLVAGNPETSARKRLLAHLALNSVSPNDDDDRQEIAKAFSEMPGVLIDQRNMSRFVSEILPGKGLDRALIFLQLLKEPTIDPASLGWYGGLGTDANGLSEALVGSILDAMEARLAEASSPDQVAFSGVAEEFLSEMQRTPDALFRESLVREWARDRDLFVAGARAAKAADREDLLVQMCTSFAQRLAGERDNRRVSEGLGRLAAVPGKASTQAVLIYAEQASSEWGREAALNQVRALVEVAALGRQLEESEEAPSKAKALADIVALLESPTEVVRLEAIRSIATMGAVEYIPRLIAFLPSEIEAERLAARHALDVLHKQAERE